MSRYRIVTDTPEDSTPVTIFHSDAYELAVQAFVQLLGWYEHMRLIKHVDHCYGAEDMVLGQFDAPPGPVYIDPGRMSVSVDSGAIFDVELHGVRNSDQDQW